MSTNSSKAKSNEAKASTGSTEYKPNIIMIGPEGRIDSRSREGRRPSLYKSPRPVAQRSGSSNMTKLLIPSIYHDKEITEISKSEIFDEVVNPDIQYFMTFCSLLYLVRSLYMTYGVIITIDRFKLSFETNFELALFLINFFFAVSLLVTAITGYFFCWKMNLKFAFPFLFALFVSTLLISAKLIILIIWFEEDIPPKKKQQQQGLYEAAFDCVLLVLNIVISFCTTQLYEQISESTLAVDYEPDQIVVDGRTYERTVNVNKRISYIAKKASTQGSSETSD